MQMPWVWGREQLVNRNSQSMSASRMVNGSTRSSAMSDFLKSFSHFLPISDWLFVKVILICTTFACLLHLIKYSAVPLQIFVQLEWCTSYWGSRWVLSRRQYAPNKQCALNNDARLITRFYGNHFIKKFFEWKQAHVEMEHLKTNQIRWEWQNFHTIPTSCVILLPLTQICFVFVSCVQRRVVEGSVVGSACWCTMRVSCVVVVTICNCYWVRQIVLGESFAMVGCVYVERCWRSSAEYCAHL